MPGWSTSLSEFASRPNTAFGIQISTNGFTSHSRCFDVLSKSSFKTKRPTPSETGRDLSPCLKDLPSAGRHCLNRGLPSSWGISHPHITIHFLENPTSLTRIISSFIFLVWFTVGFQWKTTRGKKVIQLNRRIRRKIWREKNYWASEYAWSFGSFTWVTKFCLPNIF